MASETRPAIMMRVEQVAAVVVGAEAGNAAARRWR